VAEYCRLLIQHIAQFIEKHRGQLAAADKVYALQEVTKKPLELLRWHLSLLKAYSWHVKSQPQF